MGKLLADGMTAKEGLGDKLKTLNGLLQAPNSEKVNTNVTAALVSLQNELHKLNADLASPPPADKDKRSLASRLQSIQERLDAIENAIKDSQPQRLRRPQ
jgi:cob(I)alamin adenosyltransferase